MSIMSYANSGSGRERIVAIGLVGLIQGGIIAALVSGLAVQFATKVTDPPLSTYNVPNDPLPPPPDMRPPETKSVETVAQPLSMPVTPTPLVAIDMPSPTVTTVDMAPPPTIDFTPIPIPSPSTSPTPAADMSRGASARGSVADWFPRSEYPAAALRAGAEGRVSVMVTIAPSGRATGCEVVSGSGDASLDAATCRLAVRNGRFEAGRDMTGNRTATQLKLPPIVWRIED
jgi:periplasmic protein TonB